MQQKVSAMKAIVQDRYGSFEALESRDIAKPEIGDGEVLVRVHAAGLNIGVVFGVKGAPLLMRLESGLLRPKYGVPGYDFAGQVEAVGTGVTNFRPGDEVYGVANGTCAEYVRVPEDKLAIKPVNLTYDEAAALPVSALAALHGLRDAGKLQPGQRVLINGASGGVGSFAVQIAKALGAEVTGVTSTGNVEMVRSLGADHVIDYTREDFTKGGPRYDLIFDNVENRSAGRLQTGAHTRRDSRPEQRHGRPRARDAGAPRPAFRAVAVRAPEPAPLSVASQPRRPDRPDRAGRRGEAQAGHRHAPMRSETSLRRFGRSKRGTFGERSSSR